MFVDKLSSVFSNVVLVPIGYSKFHINNTTHKLSQTKIGSGVYGVYSTFKEFLSNGISEGYQLGMAGSMRRQIHNTLYQTNNTQEIDQSIRLIKHEFVKLGFNQKQIEEVFNMVSNEILEEVGEGAVAAA